MTNKAATEKKTVLWCNPCKTTSHIRHARDKVASFCPSCGKEGVQESIQVVMPQ